MSSLVWKPQKLQDCDVTLSRWTTQREVAVEKTPTYSFQPRLYQFPTAAVTKDHKLGALKQHTFIILQFKRSKQSDEAVVLLEPSE